jgi:hypothetical protein
MRILALLVAAVFVAPVPAAAGEVAWLGRLGVEYDSNAARVVGAAAEPDVVTRAFASVDGRGAVGARGGWASGVRLGARVPGSTRAEDALAAQASVSARRAEGARAWWGGAVEGRGAWLRSDERDYLSLSARLPAGAEWRWGRLSGWAGATRFVFPPAPGLASVGPDAGVSCEIPFGVAGEVSLRLDGAHRTFAERRWVEASGAFVEHEEPRRDASVSPSLMLRWATGRWLVSSGLRYVHSVSNSAARSYDRWSIEGEVAVVPVGDVLLRLAGRWHRSRYDDPELVDATLRLDDDSRSSVSVAAEIPLGAEWIALDVRGERYADRPGLQEPRYARWVAYVGVAFRGGGRAADR